MEVLALIFLGKKRVPIIQEETVSDLLLHFNMPSGTERAGGSAPETFSVILQHSWLTREVPGDLKVSTVSGSVQENV